MSLSNKIDSLKGKTFAESLAYLYKDELVEVYFGEKSGSNYYAEYDKENKIYTSGYIRGAIDNLIILEAVITTNVTEVSREILVNAWSVTAVMKKPSTGDKVHITHFFQELKR